MKAIHKFFATLSLVALCLAAIPAAAQNALTEGIPAILAPHAQTVNYMERTLCYTIKANVAFNVTTDAEWVSVARRDGNTVYLHIQPNYEDEGRTANIKFLSEDGPVEQVLVLTQTKDESANEVPQDIEVKPSSATDNTHQGDADVSKTLDNDYSTMYHSQWSGFNVSESNPAILTYNFRSVETIDYVNYVPRQGGGNGDFGRVKIYITLQGQSEQLYGTYDFGQKGMTYTVSFAPALEKPTRIRFEVLSGKASLASCAEMEFRAKDPKAAAEFSIFGDEVYTTLRPGVTADDIEAIDNGFIKSLATKLFRGTYSKDYRVATYECFSSPEYLSDKVFNAPGKYYDHCEGVTGINIPKGRHAIVVSGIPESLGSVGLRVVAWFSRDLNEKGEGAAPAVYTYGLRNGLNVIDYSGDKDGLAYINYYIYGVPNKTDYPDIKVHFINGQVNGYLSKDKTNDEMHEICNNAVNRCMDVVGQRVHSVWQASGLYNYCKTSTGANKGYHQFMNVLDSLIVWEHRLLGFEKYNRIPRNHTMAYVNYTYYMFQGHYGVSFMYNQESRVLNCQTLMTRDNDAIWGLSHEWGHQHQMFPYFCWGSLGEVSNNMNSYYNIQAMGYHGESDKIRSYWPEARRKAFDDIPFKNGSTYMTARRLAYQNRSNFSYNSDFSKLAELMKDSLAYPATDDKVATWTFNGQNYDITSRMLGFSHSEMGGEALTPFVMLYLYASRNWRTDFGPDLYEALRQTDNENGSVIEKTNGIDKYELIAAVQKGMGGNFYQRLCNAYPGSCWVKRGYLSKNNINRYDNGVPFILNFIRKCSRLTGKNLFPYFERWGFLRTVALQIGDYGTYYQLMTPEMYVEFKADMQQLVTDGVLEDIDDATVTAISNSKDMWEVEFGTTPNIPNR